MGHKRHIFLYTPFFLFSVSTAVANDEYAKNQAAFDASNLAQAYALGYTGKGVTVAVIDTGVLLTHQELASKVSELQDSSYNTYTGDHGTHVAGIVAAAKDGKEMHGVAYNASILSFSTNLTGSCTTCMSASSVFSLLAESTLSSVKIINASFGTDTSITETVETIPSFVTALVAADKLIVSSAGNEKKLSPVSSPAGYPYYDSTLAGNIISVIAYDPSKTGASATFISSYSNLAVGAQKWSIAAPGNNIYSSVASSVSSYGVFQGTSMAAPMVSGAAALVSEAFPYMGGKEIADTLLSTANSDYSSFSDYMIQTSDGKSRLLFFGSADGYGKDWTDDEKNAKVAAELGAGKTCSSEGVECNNVVYADVFGQGVLDIGKAVKGPAKLDADRLTAAEYINEQYYYPVDTKGYSVTWKNDVSQVKSSVHPDADVGLKKSGSGTLTLAGNNTYAGTTAIDGGTISLTGTLTGKVAVERGGTFSLNGGTVKSTTTVDTGAALTMTAGTFAADVASTGAITAFGGNIAGNLTSSYSLEIQGNGFTVAGDITNSGTATVRGATFVLSAGKIFANTGNVIVEAGAALNLNGGTFTGDIVNAGRLSGTGSFECGKAVNTGMADTSLSFDTLESSGRINIVKAVNGSGTATMTVNTLKITGGSFVFSDKSGDFYRHGDYYRVIDFTTLESFSNFENNAKVSDFITTNAIQSGNSIGFSASFSKVSESASLTGAEKNVAMALDSMYFDQNNRDVNGYYYSTQNELKKKLNTVRQQAKPVSVHNLPLSKTMGRRIFAHLFERQSLKAPSGYDYRYKTPETFQGNERYVDPYRYYRPDSQYREPVYHRQAPQKRDIYRNFRPNGRSGGDSLRPSGKIWGQFIYGNSTQTSSTQTTLSDMETTDTGVMFGWDFIRSPDFLWGVTAGYALSDGSAGKDTITATDTRLGLYFSKQKGFWSIDGLLTAGIQDYDKKRYTVLSSETFEHKSSFSGQTIQADLTVGYDFQPLPLTAGDFSSRPYIGVSAVRSTQDAYKEKGNSGLNLAVKSVSNTSVSVMPGVIAGFVVDPHSSFFLFNPEYVFADIGFKYALTGSAVKGSASFVNDSLQTSFDTLETEDKSLLSIGVGFTGNIGKQIKTDLYFNYSKSSEIKSGSISFTVGYEF